VLLNFKAVSKRRDGISRCDRGGGGKTLPPILEQDVSGDALLRRL
jgi:hypothetical protein